MAGEKDSTCPAGQAASGCDMPRHIAKRPRVRILLENAKAARPLVGLLSLGSGRRIRTLTYRVRVCCATLTQSRYIIFRLTTYIIISIFALLWQNLANGVRGEWEWTLDGTEDALYEQFMAAPLAELRPDCDRAKLPGLF